MAHLEAEDMARLIEGNVDKDEREQFLKHFSQCRFCLNAYTDTLKFIEEEKKGKLVLKFPILKKIRNFSYGFWWDFLSDPKVYIPALAVLIVLIVMLPFGRGGEKVPDKDVMSAKLLYIKESIEKMETTSIYAIAPSKDKTSAAVRAGFLVEELQVVLDAGGKEKVKTKLTRMLTDELKVILKKKKEPGLPLPDLENIKKENFKKIIADIEKMVESEAIFELYGFGRFVERCILSTFENKPAGKKEIEKYRLIAQKHQLPEGVFKRFEQIKITDNIIKNRKTWIAVKEIF